MASEQETVADIITELRQCAEYCTSIERVGIYERFANRIEAAYQRDSQSWQGTIRKLTAAIAEQGEENTLMRHALERVRRNLSMTYHDEEEERNLIVDAFNVAGNALLATEKKAEEKGAYDGE